MMLPKLTKSRRFISSRGFKFDAWPNSQTTSDGNQRRFGSFYTTARLRLLTLVGEVNFTCRGKQISVANLEAPPRETHLPASKVLHW